MTGQDLDSIATEALLDALARRFPHMVFHGAKPNPNRPGLFFRTIKATGDKGICLSLCRVAAESICDSSAN